MHCLLSYSKLTDILFVKFLSFIVLIPDVLPSNVYLMLNKNDDTSTRLCDAIYRPFTELQVCRIF